MTDVEIRRSGERFVTTTDWLVSRHSFSFGQHYDPNDVGFGPLLVCNEDVLSAGAGFDTHPHAGVDIVTWVLEGELTHRDSADNVGVVRAGRVQRLSAGRGVEHSERNEGAGPAHYVQMWIASEEPDAEPGYAQRDVGAELAAGGLVPVAAGHDLSDKPVLSLSTSAASLHVARLAAGDDLSMPTAPLLHIFVTRGVLDVSAASDIGRLEAGDAMRCRSAVGLHCRATEPAELLVWELNTLS